MQRELNTQLQRALDEQRAVAEAEVAAAAASGRRGQLPVRASRELPVVSWEARLAVGDWAC